MKGDKKKKDDTNLVGNSKAETGEKRAVLGEEGLVLGVAEDDGREVLPREGLGARVGLEPLHDGVDGVEHKNLRERRHRRRGHAHKRARKALLSECALHPIVRGVFGGGGWVGNGCFVPLFLLKIRKREREKTQRSVVQSRCTIVWEKRKRETIIRKNYAAAEKRMKR